ncbi:MAG: type II toxin-antitoxin system ParD family antitoxin [Phycisphaeraceae bacterium]
MNVSLTKEHERFINKKVKSGRYQTASEVVREALRLLQDHETLREIRLKELKKEIQKGIDSLERGEGIPLTRELINDVMRRGRARLARKQQAQRRKSA